MIRPEFLLSYIGFAPELQEVRESFERIFPSALGVRLSARLSSSVFEKVLASAAEVAAYDDARASSMITGLVERLKGDALRKFETPWREQV